MTSPILRQLFLSGNRIIQPEKGSERLRRVTYLQWIKSVKTDFKKMTRKRLQRYAKEFL